MFADGIGTDDELSEDGNASAIDELAALSTWQMSP